MNMKDRKLPVVTIEDYRTLMHDQVSSDQQILKRLRYLESLCKNVIREELSKFSKTTKHGGK